MITRIDRSNCDMKEIRFEVKGMQCHNCGLRLRKVLQRIEGVVCSFTDHEEDEVRVVFDSNRTFEQILRSSIEQMGYEVSEAELMERTPILHRGRRILDA